MKIIDRYLLRQFVWTFLVCYFSLTGLYIVFDAFTNLEEFLRCAEKQQGNPLALMGSFYSYKSIDCFDRTAGLLTLITAMFTVTWIQRHNEMTALMSAGIPRIRVVTPVIGAAVAVALLAAANRELVMPQLRAELAKRPGDLLGDSGRKLAPRYDNHDVLIQGKAAYADGQRIEGPNFRLPPSLSDYGNLLVAENAFFRPAEAGRPGGYLMDKVQRPKRLHAQPSLSLNGAPVIITPRDAPTWLREDQCFVASDVSFEQLTAGWAWRQYASTAEMIAGLRNPSLDFGADIRVAIHGRFVQPFLDVTLLFLGLPLVVRRENRNVFIAIALAAAVVAVFMLVVIAFQYLGSIYSIRPALAAWIPLMIFVPVAVGMSESMWR